MLKASLGALALALVLPAQTSAFVNFESPQTKPIAITPDGLRLLVVNTPDNRLAVYSLATPDRPQLVQEIPVGLEPVSVRARTDDEVWVVNHVSDSISVVSLRAGHVVHTITCKDEPADVVFAGNPQRAFVTVATAREVTVLDASSRAQVGSVAIFGDEPRALCASSDGSTVFVAVQRSGNNTTIVNDRVAPLPPPPTNTNLPLAPRQGILVRADDPQWSAVHGVRLRDIDVAEIDVASASLRRTISGIGTNLQQLALRPNSNELWVANTEARNLVRFEPALRGHAVDNRVSRVVLNATPAVTAFDLNPGINYGVLPNPPALATALAQPMDLVFNGSGSELFVSAFGTDRIGVLDAQGNVLGRIEVGNVSGAAADPRNKRGPRGLVLHPSRPLLYVNHTLRNSLSVIDTGARAVLREIDAAFDPTPPRAKQGRGFLYDAKLSGNGTFSCAGCHVDGTLDGVAWDLGDRGGDMFNTIDFLGRPLRLHPMKGPTTTQTLQGLRNMAPLHWRGDRPRFQDFNPAFDKLMGGAQLSTADMDDYTAFVETVTYPSNPNQNLDRSLPTTPVGMSAQDGFNFYTTVQFRPQTRCVDCHVLGTGSNRLLFDAATLGVPQGFKVAQLRNAYKKTSGEVDGQGFRISGYAYLHDGSDATISVLLSRTVFGSLSTDAVNKTRLQRFVLAFDTGIAPAVGYQATVNASNADAADTIAALALLTTQARTNCQLVAKGVLDGRPIGLAYDAVAGRFTSDVTGDPTRTADDLRALARSNRGTFTLTGVPFGSATRIGVDRDGDGALDGDERSRSYGPATPACAPALTLTSNLAPQIGSSQHALVVAGAGAGAPIGVMIGVAPTAIPVGDLALLVASNLFVSLGADARGEAVLPLAIPAGNWFVGASVFAQAVSTAPCGLFGLRASAGLEVRIGR
jgi:DNA-binding beta-propeller fold protein YncE